MISTSHNIVNLLTITLLCQIHVAHVDGLVQERWNSIANALELHLSCTKPPILWEQLVLFAVTNI